MPETHAEYTRGSSQTENTLIIQYFSLGEQITRSISHLEYPHTFTYRVMIGVNKVSMIREPAEAKHDQNYNEHLGQLKI